jgi:hypothetical protein
MAIGYTGIRKDNPVSWLKQNRLQGPLLQVYVEFLVPTGCGETKCGHRIVEQRKGPGGEGAVGDKHVQVSGQR